MDNYKEDLQYFCKFTFGQFFTLLVLEVVTLGFVFYLGARYGNDYLKIAKDEEAPAVTEIVTAPGPAEAGSSPEVLKDHELQAMAKEALGNSSDDLKERVRALLNEQGKPKVVQPPPAPQVVTSAPTEATSLPSQTILGAKASQPETSTPADSGAIRIKSPSNAQFSIQVGSYPNMEEANGKIGEWRDRGYPAFMMIADIPDRGRWYRVRIGGFGTKEDAQKYLDTFKGKEGTEAIVVLNEQ